MCGTGKRMVSQGDKCCVHAARIAPAQKKRSCPVDSSGCARHTLRQLWWSGSRSGFAPPGANLHIALRGKKNCHARSRSCRADPGGTAHEKWWPSTCNPCHGLQRMCFGYFVKEVQRTVVIRGCRNARRLHELPGQRDLEDRYARRSARWPYLSGAPNLAQQTLLVWYLFAHSSPTTSSRCFSSRPQIHYIPHRELRCHLARGEERYDASRIC